MPHRKSVSAPWRRYKARYCLIGKRCKDCGALYFPPVIYCKKCGSKNLEDYTFSGKGKIFSYTIIRTPPAGFEERASYAIGIIQLEEGPKVLGEIIAEEKDLDIGKEVRAVFRKIFTSNSKGIIHYALKWKLEE